MTTRNGSAQSESSIKVPLAVVMISLNEGHNMEEVCRNVVPWAQEVFLVDSYSNDDTVDIALKHGVKVVQRRFRGFGDQWNFALENLPITTPWTMKLDPDERLTDDLKREIEHAITEGHADGFTIQRRIWFMDRPLPVRQKLVRVWRTGRCRFTDSLVNEYPIVEGPVHDIEGELQHLDSPDLENWLDKQNRYTTAEAITSYRNLALTNNSKLFGSTLQRRLWLKRYFFKVPFRYSLLFFYHYLWLGSWRSGWVGYAWSRLRCDVYRLWEYKLREIKITGRMPLKRSPCPGEPDPRITQY